jgi:hypothetical protein
VADTTGWPVKVAVGCRRNALAISGGHDGQASKSPVSWTVLAAIRHAGSVVERDLSAPSRFVKSSAGDSASKLANLLA